jgi:hypothetical protein
MAEETTYRRLFTLDEARTLVPVIRPAVEDLVGTFRVIREAIETTAGQSGHAIGSPDLAGILEREGTVPRLFERVKEILGTIQSHGCLVNGAEAGLVDFPCFYDNEVVFLCWKHGEPTIGHWHKIAEGFAGRRPLLDPADASDGAVSVH